MKVAVLSGGKSSEREVSLWSGEQVVEALLTKGHQVINLDPATPDFCERLTNYCPEVVFIALHGTGGEDGTIQGFLETLGYPYTGSGVRTSAIAMNKYLTKLILSEVGLKTPKGLLLQKTSLKWFKQPDWEHHFSGLAQLELPLIVKPNSQGSTIGLKVVNDYQELENAVVEALRYDNEVLVEQMISGTEITVAVLGSGAAAMALPVIEIISQKGLYDYEAKYTAGMSRHVIPARLDRVTYQQVQAVAVQAHQALDCRGMSRVDLIIANGQNYILEINTIPGMTKTSLLPDAARTAGIDFPELCEKLIEFALNDRS
ncbi:MAG TPA: D-alanine--D-alanine ligase [Bacillota bacterium]